MLFKQLAWECLNAPTRNAVAALRSNDDLHKWVVATRDLDSRAEPVAALTAFLDAPLFDRQRSNNRLSQEAGLLAPSVAVEGQDISIGTALTLGQEQRVLL